MQKKFVVVFVLLMSIISSAAFGLDAQSMLSKANSIGPSGYKDQFVIFSKYAAMKKLTFICIFGNEAYFVYANKQTVFKSNYEILNNNYKGIQKASGYMLEATLNQEQSSSTTKVFDVHEPFVEENVMRITFNGCNQNDKFDDDYSVIVYTGSGIDAPYLLSEQDKIGVEFLNGVIGLTEQNIRNMR